jgi:hypothetical protein
MKKTLHVEAEATNSDGTILKLKWTIKNTGEFDIHFPPGTLSPDETAEVKQVDGGFAVTLANGQTYFMPVTESRRPWWSRLWAWLRGIWSIT